MQRLLGARRDGTAHPRPLAGYHPSQVRDVMALCRLLLHPEDDASFGRAIKARHLVIAPGLSPMAYAP